MVPGGCNDPLLVIPGMQSWQEVLCSFCFYSTAALLDPKDNIGSTDVLTMYEKAKNNSRESTQFRSFTQVHDVS